jgi:hypothetical protein
VNRHQSKRLSDPPTTVSDKLKVAGGFGVMTLLVGCVAAGVYHNARTNDTNELVSTTEEALVDMATDGPATNATPNQLPTCTSDDGSSKDGGPCYWDAATMGNGEGTSFVQYDGDIYTLSTVDSVTSATNLNACVSATFLASQYIDGGDHSKDVLRQWHTFEKSCSDQVGGY